MKFIVFCLATLVFTFFCLAMPTRAMAAKVTIGWEYENFPLKIELHEARDEVINSTAQTGTFPLSGQGSEGFLKKISNGPWKNNFFEQKGGSYKTFLLVVKNSTDKDEYFFAAPHIVKPAKAALGHYFDCLCNSQIFKVPAHGIWYRVARLQLRKNYPEKSLTLVHSVTGIAAADAEKNLKNRVNHPDHQ